MMRHSFAFTALLLLASSAWAQQKPLTVVGGQIQQLSANTALALNPSSSASAGLNLPAGATPTTPNNGDIWATTSGIYSQVNGSTVGPFLSPTTMAGVDLSQSTAKTTGATTARPIADHLLDVLNPLDQGAVGDGVTDSGPATLSTINTALARGSEVTFPHTSAGYKVNFTPPGFSFGSYSYPGILLGEYHFNNNRFTGTGVGSPTTGAGTFNNQYTNPYNVTTGDKLTFDPAAVPQEAPVTNFGMSIEIAPNRPNALNSNPNRNWIGNLYLACDTGKGGGPGTSLPCGIVNGVLNVDTNSGTGIELDIDSNGTGTKDGGLVRGMLVAGGGNAGNNFSTASVGYDCLHSDYSGGPQPWGACYSAHSNIIGYEAWKDSSAEYGYFYTGFDQYGNILYAVDKNGYVLATGYRALPSTFSTLAACNAGQEGSQRSVTDSTTDTWGASVTGGGSIHVLAYCDGTNWTVAAK